MNAESCLVEDFFARVQESHYRNNAIVLPGQLSTFRTRNGGEALCPVDEQLHFFGPDPNNANSITRVQARMIIQMREEISAYQQAAAIQEQIN